jgi:hypothetical protein
MRRALRVVLDTSVLVSGLIGGWAKRPPPGYGRSRAASAWRISSTSAWRPSCFFENTSSPFTRTSKTPPLEGISVHEATCPSNSFSSSSVNLTARGRYPQTAQYSISTRSIFPSCLKGSHMLGPGSARMIREHR